MTSIDQSSVPSYLDLLRLDGRGYMVIGAGQGMGRQTAHALAQAGGGVFCVDIDPERANAIAAETGGIPWVGDATKRDHVERMVADAEEALGRIDGFVDIVGMARWAGILEIDESTWDWQFDICLRHAYLVSQLAGRRMLESGGTMVFISSASGLTGAPNHAAYGAAKAGLMAWVQSLAVELGPHKIRANAVAPGSILTPRIESMLSQAQLEANASNSPLGRMGWPHEVASAALFLSSDLSGYLSGQTLVLDGAVAAKFPYSSL
jgi:NAD(P)-dependent dehydrogenase (short-subunit alcohol dehydrogenase family)